MEAFWIAVEEPAAVPPVAPAPTFAAIGAASLLNKLFATAADALRFVAKLRFVKLFTVEDAKVLAPTADAKVLALTEFCRAKVLALWATVLRACETSSPNTATEAAFRACDSVDKGEAVFTADSADAIRDGKELDIALC